MRTTTPSIEGGVRSCIQAAFLVNLYVFYGINLVVLSFEIDETPRAIPGNGELGRLYYNAIKAVVNTERESTCRKGADLLY